MLLEVLKDYGLSDEQLFDEITNAFSNLKRILSSKQIEYNNLKNVLIPNPERNEAVFVFDTTKIDSSWYGNEVFKQIIPIFDKRSKHSVLCGDYVGENRFQERLYEIFSTAINSVRNYNYIHSSQFFMVYVNNLSNNMLVNFNENLFKYEPYVGYINLNNSSAIKRYLSYILSHTFIKYQNKIIMTHEDDRDNDENINIIGYPFEENGYICKSLQSLYDIFLSYKIEREVYEEFESDTLFSINAVTPNVLSVSDFDVFIEESKLNYLVENKGGKLKKAGLIDFDKNQLQKIIKEKINSNYIYNMRYLKESNTVLFNILIEIIASDTEEMVKMTVALEYQFDKKMLRLVTMF